MKNTIIVLSSLLLGCVLFITACDKSEDPDSKAQQVSVPFIAFKNASEAYVYGVGDTHIYTDLPDVIAVAVDSVYGFVGGYGGKTGSDSLDIHKTDIKSWPDTASIGAVGVSIEVRNKGNYRVVTGTNIVIAGMIPNPGPTALEGSYVRRLANGNLGVTIEIKKVFDGVYVIDNPGGAGVPPFPYLLYNHRSSTNTDSLAFPIQANECHTGTQLVSSAAPDGLRSSEYSANYPPELIPANPPAPLTLRWKVFAGFPSAKPGAIHGTSYCTWGISVRSFEKL